MAVLSLAYIATSALDRQAYNQSNAGIDQLGESLLHTRPDCYDHFEEVLVSFSYFIFSRIIYYKIDTYLEKNLEKNQN